MTRAFDAAHWDERYRATESVWGAPPNRWVEQEVASLRPGVALDLACGEGRNAIWLDSLGWQVIAVDFSAVALEKGAVAAQQASGAARITWLLDDATTFRSPDPVDLAVLAYLQLEPSARRGAVRTAATALAPGGVLLVVAHDSRNLTDGVGGPQDPAVLYTAHDLVDDLAPTDLNVERADEVLRPVEGAVRPAIDALLRARRPA
ncbi:MAG: class I SAM-dependent methyltransferase [Jatrophihabitans sp.]